MPSVSVIIPVYNGAGSIARALQSVAAQSVPALEIIVVDDGSTDATRQSVESFVTRVPIQYRLQEHRGAGAARNLGVALARGDWVAFLDADDTWYPDKLAVQCRAIGEFSSALFFYGDVDLVDESDNVLRECWASAEASKERPNSRQRLSRMLFGARPFPLPSTVLIKRQLFLQSGGFHAAFAGKYHEDFELFARLAQTASLHFIAQSLARHRRHREQSPTDAALDRRNWLIFLNCLWQVFEGRPRQQADLAWYFAKHYGDEGKRCLRAGDYSNARRNCRIAASYAPLDPNNLRHWALCFLPMLREFYTARSARRTLKTPR